MLKQQSEPGLPGVWQRAGDFSLSLKAHGGMAGKEEVDEGGGDGPREWGTPGFSRVQLKPMVVKPPLVVRLREAFPPISQTEINSVMEAAKNCEFVLVDITA